MTVYLMARAENNVVVNVEAFDDNYAAVIQEWRDLGIIDNTVQYYHIEELPPGAGRDWTIVNGVWVNPPDWILVDGVWYPPNPALVATPDA